jgi:hypothetical protein
MSATTAAALLVVGALLVGAALLSEFGSECRCGDMAFSCVDARFVDCYSSLLANAAGVDIASRVADVRAILGVAGMSAVALGALKVMRPSKMTGLVH